MTGSAAAICYLGMPLQETCQLISYCTAVSTTAGITPGHHRAIALHSCECMARATEAVHVALQLLLHKLGIPAGSSASPRNNGAVALQRSEGSSRGVDMLNTI
mmetsp:Transcript_96081/g.299227  ORF Transcript_96081/g.299227 Transcript_96081/m.299227 type:complete len:103 (-) Transcript_96081:1228-1536(-)